MMTVKCTENIGLFLFLPLFLYFFLLFSLPSFLDSCQKVFPRNICWCIKITAHARLLGHTPSGVRQLWCIDVGCFSWARLPPYPWCYLCRGSCRAESPKLGLNISSYRFVRGALIPPPSPPPPLWSFLFVLHSYSFPHKEMQVRWLGLSRKGRGEM